MNGMGQHSHPNGHRGDDGAVATLPLAIHPEFPMERFRPLTMPWAPQQEEPVSMDKTRRSFGGDNLRRASMWVLAAGVAAIAAIVSYSHIYDLGRAHGGSGVAARLLPLSVDMLILVGELMLLHEADTKGRRFVLGWVLVWSGILATLAANVTYGAAYGVAGAVIWGWPAYSFILAAGGMVAVVKRGAVRDGAPCPETDGTVHRGVDSTAPAPPVVSVDKPAVTRVDKKPSRVDRPHPRAASRRPATGVDKAAMDRAAEVLRGNPGITNAAAARLARVSAKTVQRARPLAATTGQDPEE